MGYNVIQIRSSFKIKANKHDKALLAIKKLTYSRHFLDYVNKNEVMICKTISGALNAWRWSACKDGNGDICDIRFIGGKLGDDKSLFEAIAPYVEDESYIEMCGKDGTRWRWYFKNKKVYEQIAKMSYDKVEPMEVVDIVNEIYEKHN